MTEYPRFYPLVDMVTDGSVKSPMFATTETVAAERHKFYLEEIVPHRYRLCSAEDMTAEDTTGFEIRCPYCGKALTPISASRDGKRHGLYACKQCS